MTESQPTPKKKKARPVDPPIKVEDIPLLVQRYSWMRYSKDIYVRVVYKALKLSEQERERLTLELAALQGKEPDRKWKDRVAK